MSWADDNRVWRERASRWAPEHPEPLLVRAWLASPVACDGYDPLTLEGPLQAAVCIRETGRLPDDVYAACPIDAALGDTDIQIPIVDTELAGTPIAHASIGWFSPGAIATKRQSWKRANAEDYGKPIVKVSEAANKTQMILKATVTALHLDFYMQGDRERLTDLLRDVSHIGAGRSGGLGQIEGWEVLSSPADWWWFGPGRRLMRSLPLATAVGAGQFDEREATLRAPYWHPRTRQLCGVPAQQLGEPLGQAAGEFFITGHAVRRFRERVPGAGRLSYDQALGELIRTMRDAHFVKTLNNGLDLWRGPKPHRLRLRVAAGRSGLLPQLVTVVRGCDAGWQRGSGACR